MPDIGDFKDVPIIEVMVKAGDTVKPEQPLVTLESDKASMEVPSPLGGVVQDLKAKIGDRVSEGAVILTLVTGAGGGASAACGHRPRPQRRRNRAAPAAALPPAEPEPVGDGGRHPLCRAIGPKACARARRRLASGEGKRTARPHPPGGRRQFRQGAGRSRRGRRTAAAPRRTEPRSACCRGRRSISPSSGRSRPSRWRASRRSPAPTCTATG